MNPIRNLTPEIAILPSEVPIPGFGTLAVNAYLLKSQQPVLIDTGLIPDHEQFMAGLESLIDPADLRWIYLTHPDQDHIGSLMTVLERAPQAKLVTTYLGYGILSLFAQIPPDRLYLLNPGETLDVGDRQLTAHKPPTFDNPTTTAVLDSKSRVLFSSDCFGALLPEQAEAADAIDAETLRRGQVTWTTIDAPWVQDIDRGRFASQLNLVRQMSPELVLSAHLPPASGGMIDTLLANVAATQDEAAFVGPNQAALEAMLAQMTGSAAAV